MNSLTDSDVDEIREEAASGGLPTSLDVRMDLELLEARAKKHRTGALSDISTDGRTILEEAVETVLPAALRERLDWELAEHRTARGATWVSTYREFDNDPWGPREVEVDDLSEDSTRSRVVEHLGLGRRECHVLNGSPKGAAHVTCVAPNRWHWEARRADMQVGWGFCSSCADAKADAQKYLGTHPRNNAALR